MELIDTHVHVIDRSRLAYPWLANVPALDRDHSFDAWQAEAKHCGITGGLHMEVDVAEADIEDETGMVEELAARPGSILKGAISACRPEDSGFPVFLERALARPSVKGFRRVLHVVPDEVSTRSLFRENVRRLSGTGRPFDLCIRAKQLPLAIELVESAPDVQFVLDHCGNPGIRDGEFQPWAGHIHTLSRRPNVAVKISGISAPDAPAGWSVEDLAPYVSHCLEAFGLDRAVWGGDWPVVTLGSSLSTWVAATQALVSGISADEKTQLFSANAKRIWQI